MDHLSIPDSAQGGLSSLVPYVASRRYDGGPFLTYPKRLLPPKNYFCSTSTFQIHHDMTDDAISTTELESFLQIWLFFGLLNEIFGEGFKYEDFLEITGSGSTNVTGRQLDVLFEKLQDEIKSWTYEAWAMREKHINQCIQVTFTVLSTVAPDVPNFHSTFNPAIRNSICFLANSIERLYTISPTQFHRKSDMDVRDWKYLVCSSDLKQMMIQNGWCPSQVEEISDHSPNLETFWYLSRLRKTTEVGKHNTCDPTHCRTLQINRQTYNPQHCWSGCRCTEFIIDRAAVDRILQDGSYPVLKMAAGGADEQVSLYIERADVSGPYIAISHVWADGMGNPLNNALHICWMTYLRHIAAALLTHEDYHLVGDITESQQSGSNSDQLMEANPSQQQRGQPKGLILPVVRIWIDTLCCPTEPPALKTLAIERMREVYQCAHDVLVLDSNLRALRSDSLDDVEIWFRITTSNWARRLWTTQEAYLAKRIWFQFAEGACSGQTLLQYLMLKSQSREQIYSGCVISTSKITPIRLNDKQGIGFYNTLFAVLGRSVSEPSDEPLCLATLLGIDLKKVAQYRQDIQSGMCQVWKLGSQQYDISQDIVFHKGKRLTRNGFRWGPQSLMELNNHGLRMLRGVKLGQLTDAGMKISATGFRFRKEATEITLPHEANLFLDTTQDELAIRTDGKWLGCILHNGAWKSYFTLVRNQTRKQNVEGIILLQHHTVEELLSYNLDDLSPGLLGYIFSDEETNVFSSVGPCSVFVYSPDYAKSLEQLYLKLAGFANEKENFDELRTIQQLLANSGDAQNDATLSVSRLTERLREVLEIETQSEEFKGKTGRRFEKVEPTVIALLSQSARFVESLDNQEWIID